MAGQKRIGQEQNERARVEHCHAPGVGKTTRLQDSKWNPVEAPDTGRKKEDDAQPAIGLTVKPLMHRTSPVQRKRLDCRGSTFVPLDDIGNRIPATEVRRHQFAHAPPSE